MTNARLVTRADGSPAYLNARPRKRQSDFNRKRSYVAMYREMQESCPGEPHPLAGSLLLLGGAILMMSCLYGVAWIFA